MKQNIGEYVTTFHNPETVVEVYVNREKSVVTELKSLSDNREKKYHYSVDDYLSIVKDYKGVDLSLNKVLSSS